jgi:hypothetical protein
MDLCCDWNAALLRIFSAVNERCLPAHSLGDTLSRILSLGLEVGFERKGSIGGPTNRGWGARGGMGIGAE